MEFLKFYKENFLRKQILLFIICLVIFLIAFSFGMSTIDFNAPFNKDVNELANINLIQIQFIFVMVLAPILALIPFVKKLSILTVFYSYFMAFSVTNMFYLPTCNKILLAISVVLSLFALSLNIVLSLELSEKINKKFVKIINRKKQKNNNDINSNTEEKDIILKRKVIFITFVICMIITIINLIITKFI